MNLIDTYTKNTLNKNNKTTQSFYFSTKYKNINPNNPKTSSIKKTIYLYLNPKTINNNNHSKNDTDNLTTIFKLIIHTLDITNLIPNPTVDNNDYKIIINNVNYKPTTIQLININNKLHLYTSIKTLKTNIKTTNKYFIYPNTNNKLTIDEIVIATDLMISTKNNKATMIMKNTNVQLLKLDVDVNSILGSLFDFIIDTIVNNFKSSLIKEFKKKLNNQIPDTLADTLNSLTFLKTNEFSTSTRAPKI